MLASELFETKLTEGKDPCWKGYKQLGTKDKNGRTVPNCVPVDEDESETEMQETLLNPNDIKGDYAAKKKALHDLSMTPGVDQRAVQQRKLDLDKEAAGKGIKNETTNAVDTVTMDVPLMIRMLEYAREDAKTDMDLHDVAERLIQLSSQGRCLSMSDYESIVPKN